MISADDARVQTINNNDNLVVKELNEIEKRIRKAVSEGKYHIDYIGYLKRRTISILNNLGYWIEFYMPCGKPLYTISWR